MRHSICRLSIGDFEGDVSREHGYYCGFVVELGGVELTGEIKVYINRHSLLYRTAPSLFRVILQLIYEGKV